MKITRYKTDRNLEENGVWVDLGDGGLVKIARFNNSRYEAAVAKMLRSNMRRKMQSGNVKPDELRKVHARLMADYIILDWEGIEDEDGKEIPYSSEKAYEYLLEYRDFYEDIEFAASQMATFKAEEEAIDEGNSPAS